MIESDLFVAANVGDNHFKIVGELIKDYRRLKRAVKDPMVMVFEQIKEYQILAEVGLTPALWVKKPYATYSSLEMVEYMVEIKSEKSLMDKIE
jgi:hypothetical protein